MTIQEASERYRIPLHILREYERWGLCRAVKDVMGAWQYDQTDIERLSLILTLHDVGFAPEEVEHYMRLLLVGDSTKEERAHMLKSVGTARWSFPTMIRSFSAIPSGGAPCRAS